MLWQLKRLSNGEELTKPGELPEDWGPIFGLSNIKDRLNDLSWLGPSYSDLGWFEVEGELPEPPAEATKADLMWEKAKAILKDTDYLMLVDAPINAEQRASWQEYRKKLRNIREQTGFPDNIVWPDEPR